MTIHEHLMQTRAICDAATPGAWWPEDKDLCCPTLELARDVLKHSERRLEAVMMPTPPFAFGGLCAIIFSEAEGAGNSIANRDFIIHARTALPRFAKALEVAVMGIDGEIGAASCCGRTTQYARLHKLRAEIQAALEGR